jgi:hypothetical protein
LRIKRDLRPYGLLGFFLLLGFSYLSFGVELLIATIGLGLIELAALSFGQYNMLNVLTGNQKAILVTSFAVSAVSFFFYILVRTGVYIDDPNLGFSIYGIILLLWQFASYLTHRYA